ncbi:class I SAM-dependent methyltransferase [Pikeienuella piscinae]|uniref:Class I SAM-dependent methyltransferase n=1 Tax=Pikeienuella piscinae TaxID=2748098 RepID=A0A7L5BYS8_9RHOB|nr:class I SAM-dependent methyltransferase [Pikeienuella piscinae]QIE54759.1 class I SAM-dependent methyltransferase [Pikeienuella piscinae]
MDVETVKTIFETHWRKGWGSVSVQEAMFIQEVIAADRPKAFVEIGAASGISGGLICRMLAENGGENFTTYDLSHKFFGDLSKPAGYLIDEIYPGGPITVERRFGFTALDIIDHGASYEMAFVDGNHKHPWPLIDTLFLSEVLGGSRKIIHHDLRLYRLQPRPIGIGPKYLFDQFPEARRRASTANRGNIFHIDLTMKTAALAEIAEAAIHLPWTLSEPLDAEQMERIRALIERVYGAQLLAAFDKAAERYNFTAPAYRPARAAAAPRKRAFGLFRGR